MIKNKILLFTDWYEPGFKAGGPIQACKNTVNTFSEEYDFWIFTSDRDLGDKESYKNIKTNTWIQLPNGAHIFYSSPEFRSSSRIRKIITQVQPKIVYLSSMFSPYFSLLPLWILRSENFSCRIILAPRGMLNTSAVSRKKWKKKIFLYLFAHSRISKNIVFQASCKQEEEDVKKYFGNNARVYITDEIPNVNEKWTARDKQPGQLNCIFISRIHPIKNLLYAINVVKNIAGCSILFDIYGPVEDATYFQKCKEAASQTNPHIKVNFKGSVANTNIFEVLQYYHCFLLPTQGENFGHVIFEALTSGCVVLISDKTPWNNIEQKNAGWTLPLSNQRSFTEKVEMLCHMNEWDYNEKSKAAFQYANEFLSSMNLKARYSSLFQTNE